MKNYVVGYGSLINSDSRKITGLTGEAWPIWLLDFERSWSAQFPELSFCALAVNPKANSKICAVLFEIFDLPAFDEREMGYDRVSLSAESILPFAGDTNLPQNVNFWIYIPKYEILGTPNMQNIIWQSYVDVCISGCIEYGEEFASEFITGTQAWNMAFWANDRESSKYVRALKYFEFSRIDNLLEKFQLSAHLEHADDQALQRHVRNRLKNQ